MCWLQYLKKKRRSTSVPPHPFFGSVCIHPPPAHAFLLLVPVAQQRPRALQSQHPFCVHRLSSALLVNEQANLWLSISPLALALSSISTTHVIFPQIQSPFFCCCRTTWHIPTRFVPLKLCECCFKGQLSCLALMSYVPFLKTPDNGF